MSSKLATALVAILVASVLPAPAAGSRDNPRESKLAQYCMPHDADLPGTTRVYC